MSNYKNLIYHSNINYSGSLPSSTKATANYTFPLGSKLLATFLFYKLLKLKAEIIAYWFGLSNVFSTFISKSPKN